MAPPGETTGLPAKGTPDKERRKSNVPPGPRGPTAGSGRGNGSSVPYVAARTERAIALWRGVSVSQEGDLRVADRYGEHRETRCPRITRTDAKGNANSRKGAKPQRIGKEFVPGLGARAACPPCPR